MFEREGPGGKYMGLSIRMLRSDGSDEEMIGEEFWRVCYAHIGLTEKYEK